MSDVQSSLYLQGTQPANLIATSSNPLFNDTASSKGLFWIIKIILMFVNAFSGMIGEWLNSTFE